MTDRPLIRLNPGADRRVKAGHPWAFSNEIAMTPAARAIPPGSVVRLEGDDGVRHGAWHFNPHSLIAARWLDADPMAGCDAAWLRDRRPARPWSLRRVSEQGPAGISRGSAPDFLSQERMRAMRTERKSR